MAFLTERKAVIIRDLKFKTDAEDWHGVADCAMDLREVEARMDMLTPLSADEQEAARRYVAPTL